MGKETFKNYNFGGVSCGTAVAGFFYLAVNTENDLKHYYKHYIRKFFEKENRKYYGLVTTGKLIYDISKEIY